MGYSWRWSRLPVQSLLSPTGAFALCRTLPKCRLSVLVMVTRRSTWYVSSMMLRRNQYLSVHFWYGGNVHTSLYPLSSTAHHHIRSLLQFKRCRFIRIFIFFKASNVHFVATTVLSQLQGGTHFTATKSALQLQRQNQLCRNKALSASLICSGKLLANLQPPKGTCGVKPSSLLFSSRKYLLRLNFGDSSVAAKVILLPWKDLHFFLFLSLSLSQLQK